MANTEAPNTVNAATLGLGFHSFDGNVAVKDVMHQIGADFAVREDSLVRIPSSLLEQIWNGEAVTIPTDYIVNTHKATVRDDTDRTIGVVGKSYGLIQNNSCFEVLDMMCNASVTDNPLRIVSAGMVHEFEPYLQAEIPSGSLRIEGDPSDTKFYAFVHTSHDGSSGLQVRFSPVRVVCQNTFMANVSSKCGFTFRHSSRVQERLDLTEEANVKRIRERVASLQQFSAEYVDKMNQFRAMPVDEAYVRKFMTEMFVDDEKVKAAIAANNGRFEGLEEVSTRLANTMTAFRNTLESSEGGQDFARGSRLWLFNGLTAYNSNTASYGNMRKDSDYTRAEKRFDALMDGAASRRVMRAMDILAA